MSTTVFENKTCTRCGGSGKFSWCQSHGSTCFKCQGTGWNWTKRGEAAYAYFVASLHAPAATLAIGDMVRVEHWYPAGTIRAWQQVTRIERSLTWDMVHFRCEPPERLRVKRPSCTAITYTVEANAPVRVEWTHAEKAAKQAAALAYEQTLTKLGKPRKRQTA